MATFDLDKHDPTTCRCIDCQAWRAFQNHVINVSRETYDYNDLLDEHELDLSNSGDLDKSNEHE